MAVSTSTKEELHAHLPSVDVPSKVKHIGDWAKIYTDVLRAMFQPGGTPRSSSFLDSDEDGKLLGVRLLDSSAYKSDGFALANLLEKLARRLPPEYDHLKLRLHHWGWERVALTVVTLQAPGADASTNDLAIEALTEEFQSILTDIASDWSWPASDGAAASALLVTMRKDSSEVFRNTKDKYCVAVKVCRSQTRRQPDFEIIQDILHLSHWAGIDAGATDKLTIGPPKTSLSFFFTEREARFVKMFFGHTQENVK